ncbi:MAG: CDP-alcohol phosphatidyltransferase family protein [Candidatus Undinarchaeales archaeon]|jgi:phosphatidylglycerophosphate synthase|nr:CDP-alcohol phosphatidyltransferase family protein [Candidatus Undinarchaeales archaeon]
MGFKSYYESSFKFAVESLFYESGKAIASLGIKPNHLTFLQLPFSLLMFYYLLTFNLSMGMLCAFFVLFFDSWDGVVARASNQESRWGHLFDKGADIFNIILILSAISVYSPQVRFLALSLIVINVLIFITNEIKEPFVYTAARGAGLAGLMFLSAVGSFGPMIFFLTISLLLGSTLLLWKVWFILRNLGSPKV